MEPAFEYIFPAIRGIQAGREYYTSMCPLRLIPKIFLFNEEELVPELRAQRTLNKARVPEMTRYILNNPKDYIFSAITASIDAEVRFEPLGDASAASRVGTLHVPMDAPFIINDGQHRRAAIEAALLENPDIADETIAVVFFLDLGLKKCQQMFADLNRYAIRPSKSLGVLYDYRDDHAIVAKRIAIESSVFKDLVEMERSNLAERSRKLFTLSSIYFATKELLDGIEGSEKERGDIALSYWEEVAKYLPDWLLVRTREMSSCEVRRDFIHSHGIALQSIGKAGNALLKNGKKTWKKKLSNLGQINWSRSNVAIWEGRAMVGGRISKSSNNITLTTNYLKQVLGIKLGPQEKRVEDAWAREPK